MLNLWNMLSKRMKGKRCVDEWSILLLLYIWTIPFSTGQYRTAFLVQFRTATFSVSQLTITFRYHFPDANVTSEDAIKTFKDKSTSLFKTKLKIADELGSSQLKVLYWTIQSVFLLRSSAINGRKFAHPRLICNTWNWKNSLTFISLLM